MDELGKMQNWDDFLQAAVAVSKKERGDMFELLTKHYLLIEPTYKTRLSDVWLWSEVPPSVKERLGLQSRDMGIDLIAKTKTGGYWAIQCKYRSNRGGSLSWGDISTFVGLSFIRDRFEYCLIAYTGEKYSSILKQADEGRIGFLSSDKWEELDQQFFAQLHAQLKGADKALEPRRPRPHQQRAIDNAKSHFIQNGNTRGKLIMPCGAGKSLTAFWITEALKAKTVIVAVPSLALIQQTLPDWLREYSARGDTEKLRWLCVCSDKTVAHDVDAIAVHTHDLGFPCSTDITQVRKWLRDTEGAAMRVVFTTYQSGEILSAAFRAEEVAADIGIMDEAHKTVGQRGKLFTHLLFDENIFIKRRLFMTATERRFAGRSDEIVSMDDIAIYGEVFEQLSFKKALEDRILSDYRIVTRIVSSADVEKRIQKNANIRVEQGSSREVEPQMLASAVTLAKSAQQLPIRHSVSFHSSVSKAKQFRSLYSNIYKDIESDTPTTETFHVSGDTPAAERKATIREFARASRALITNARCLTEGVDVPNIDCVLFADPRRSKVDIVQAVGRALRRAKDKECGYVLIPVVSHGEPPNVFVESEAFQAVIEVIRALAANDERLIDYFGARRDGRKYGTPLLEIYADEQITEFFDIKEFEEHIGIKIWRKVTPLTQRYLPYDEAIKFVHQLKLKGFKDWFSYVKGGHPELPPKPENIPSAAHNFYSDFQKRGGWKVWTGNRPRGEYGSYDDAIRFVHLLKLKGSKEWRRYTRGDFPHLPTRPVDIPSNPDTIYPEWYDRSGYPGWVGSGRKPIPRGRHKKKRNGIEYLPYAEARAFVRTLKLKKWVDWEAYRKSGQKPSNIPGAPSEAYGDEYINGGAIQSWLGTEKWFRDNPNG